jgi:hypothetical protein
MLQLKRGGQPTYLAGAPLSQFNNNDKGQGTTFPAYGYDLLPVEIKQGHVYPLNKEPKNEQIVIE